MSQQGFRQSLGLPGLLKNMRQSFEKIPDPIAHADIPLSDHLMSGLAIFGLKYPSLLQFDQDRSTELTRSNLKSLYGIQQAPSDTYLRERLDEVDPRSLRKHYTQLLQLLQRGKGLEGFAYMNEHYLYPLTVQDIFHPVRFIVINVVKNITVMVGSLIIINYWERFWSTLTTRKSFL